LVGVTVAEVDATAPTAPLVGAGWADAGPLWDFFGNGNASARAEYATFDSAGPHVVSFGAAEGGEQLPDYVTVAAFFDSAAAGGIAQGAGAPSPLPVGGAHLAVSGRASAPSGRAMPPVARARRRSPGGR
jgi:hypothetical protein